jgi:hypothetical protein
MQQRLNINLSSLGQVDPGLSITNAVRSIYLANAAETEDLELLSKAVAACAKREAGRVGLVFGADAIRTVLTAEKAQMFEDHTEALSKASERPQEVLKLLK